MDANTLERRQNDILRELHSIRCMKKGSIVHQQWPAERSGKRPGTVYGPYPLLTWKEQGRTKSVRLKTPREVAWAEAAIENYRRFAELCREYEALAEQAALGQRTAQDSASNEAEKKGIKSRRKPRGR